MLLLSEGKLLSAAAQEPHVGWSTSEGNGYGHQPCSDLQLNVAHDGSILQDGEPTQRCVSLHNLYRHVQTYMYVVSL